MRLLPSTTRSVSLRRPAPDGAAGLVWPIPEQLDTEVKLSATEQQGL